MANTINIKINQEVNGKNKVDELGVSLKKLKETINNVQSAAKAIDITTLIVAADAVNSAVTSMVSTMQDLAGAYQIQQQAETQLATVMKQRMDATDKDIQKIKELASAQQELGIIGDEVQLAGAQQVATFLTQRASLETLLPAMNNLIAQQKGYNATSGDAVNIANLMGKAMQGQTSALRRVGITFTEAQEEALKFGSEQERAAMLAQIITDNVGNMNAELANTSSGQMKQLSNTLGDIKESIGAFAQSAMPFMTIFASAVTATTGLVKLYAASKRCYVAMRSFGLATKTAQVALLPFVGSMRKAKIVIDLIGKASTSAAAKTVVLKLALKSLLISTGIGAAIWAVCEAIDALTNSSEDASEKIDVLAEANDNFNKKAAEIETSVYKDIRSLKSLVDANQDTTTSVKEMNDKYGESFGYYKTANEWVEVLTKNVRLYAEANAYAAKMEELLSKKIELQYRMRKLQADNAISIDGKKYTYSDIDKQYNKGNKGLAFVIMARAENDNGDAFKEYKEALNDISDINKELGFVEENANNAAKALAKVREGSTAKPGNGNDTTPTFTPNKKEYDQFAKNLQGYEDNISVLNDRLKTASKEEAAAINKEIDFWQKKADEIRNAGKEVETVTQTVKQNVEEFQNEIDVTELSTQAGRAKIKTLKEIDDAVSALGNAMQDATADEIIGYQKTIRLLEKKRDALSGETILDNQNEIDALNELGKKELRVKIQGMGFEALAEKVKEIDKLLNDLDNPPTDGQRKMLEEQRSQYAQWARQAVNSFDTYLKGWDTIQATGNGIMSITDAIRGNGDAWSKITGIINGVIQVYQGISAIVGLVNMFTAATSIGATAETQKAAASTATATAMGVESGMAGAAALANIPLIASNKLATASFMEMAAAAYFAAHAYIPFVGAGIAAGYISASVATVQGIAVTPFAEGGIITGPTLGLMGEYPGARNNPEIVAPLDKLRSLIEPQNGIGGEVEFKIKGRRLVGILSKENSHYSRM